jgi:hypothetical protein
VTIAHAENHARDAVAIEGAVHLPQAGAERSAMRSPKRPPEFDFLNILANCVTLGFEQFENPIANRFVSRRIHIESRRQFFRAVDHLRPMCQKWHNLASSFWF